MIYCLHVGACLCLIVIQTTALPSLAYIDKIFDLLIPFVIYLALYRPVREGLILVFFLGFIMDNLSGGPFGLFLTTYCWLFIGVKWTIKYVQVVNRLLLSLVVVAGVLLENLVFIGTSTFLGAKLELSAAAMRTVALQMTWALVTGPLFLIFFRHSQQRLDSLMKRIVARPDNFG